jgi:rod shape-determining protein MreB and related proteins
VTLRKLKLNLLRGILSPTIGVDLGTSWTRICVAGRGVVVHEPSVVVRRSRHHDGEVLAGTRASDVLLRTNGGGTAVRPVQHGVVADFSAAQDMLRCFLRGIVERWHAPCVVFSVPSGATDAERRAFHELGEALGASEALLVDTPIAAALGAGLPIDQAIGSMVVDVGAGKAEAAVLNLWRVMRFQSVRSGGEAFDRAIANRLRDSHGILVGTRMAEGVKIRAAYVECARGTPEPLGFLTGVRGLDLSTGLLVDIEVAGSDIAATITPKVDGIVGMVANTLEHLPLEIFSDISTSGIMLTGGGAALSGLPQRISKDVGIAVTTVEAHEDSVVSGLSMIVSKIDQFRPLLYSMYR